jgi:hypothetical protein
MILTSLLMMLQLAPPLDAIPVRAVRTDRPPSLDGIPSETVWAEAVPVDSPFIQHRPSCGEPLTEPTEIRVLYDDRCLYIAFSLRDSHPESFRRILAPRDEDFSTECAGIWLDTFDDDNNAYFFFVSIENVQQDGRLCEVSGWDLHWDAVWESATASSDSGWSAELAIPFSALRYSSDSTQVWGVNFKRTITRTNESGFLFPMADDGTVRIADFGELTGLEDLPDTRRVELRPYAAGRLNSGTENEEWDTWGSAGVDCRVGIATSSVLDLTVNPDFGQVEADPDQANLSNWEPYLTERRPFFMEGADLFSLPFMLFYSRRIGSVASDGEIIPILGGAKLTGVSSGFRYGVLEAYTRSVSEGGQIIEPATNYAVTRLLREFGQGTYLGLSMTSTDMPGVDGAAYQYGRSGAVDGQLQIAGCHTLSGAVAGTWNSDMERWTDNLAWKGWYGYSDERFSGSTGFSYKEDDFDANLIGYTSATGEVSTWTEAELFMPSQGGGTLDHGWLNAYYGYDQVPGGPITSRELYLDGGVVFSNRFYVGANASASGSWTDRYEGPDGQEYDRGVNLSLNASNDSRRKLYVYAWGGFGGYRNGRSRDLGAWINYKPTPSVSLVADIGWSITDNALRYNWSAGSLDSRDTDWQSLELSGSYMFSNDLSLTLSSQLSSFTSIYGLTGTTETLNHWMNALLSWSFRPGSMLYLLAGEDAEPEEDGTLGEPHFTIYSKVTWFI